MLRGIQASSDNGGAEVCNARARFVDIHKVDVHKDVFLAGCQCSISGFRTMTYWLEVSMNQLARVDVVDTLRNIEQLVTRVSTGSSR